MNFNSISAEQKRAILESTIANIEYELYRELLLAGIDPDSFSGLSDIENSDNPDLTMRLPRFTEIMNRLTFAQGMLNGL